MTQPRTERLQILPVAFPDTKEDEEEDLQSLVDIATAPFKETTQCPCDEDDCTCNAQVGMSTQKLILNGDTLIVQLQRLTFDLPKKKPVMKPGEIQPALNYKHNGRGVTISPTLNVPSSAGLRLSSARYALVCTIQHRGGISKSGISFFIYTVKCQNYRIIFYNSSSFI